jgi:hypothetical protein
MHKGVAVMDHGSEETVILHPRLPANDQTEWLSESRRIMQGNRVEHENNTGIRRKIRNIDLI